MKLTPFFFAFFFTFPRTGGVSSCDKECEDEQQGLPHRGAFFIDNDKMRQATL